LCQPRRRFQDVSSAFRVFSLLLSRLPLAFASAIDTLRFSREAVTLYDGGAYYCFAYFRLIAAEAMPP